MDDNQYTGAIHADTGAAETAADRLQAKTRSREAGQAAMGDLVHKVTDGIAKIGDQASGAVTKLADQASSAYDRAASGVQRAGDRIEPSIQQRPFAALGIAAGVGLILGLLAAGRRPKGVFPGGPH